MLIKDRVYGEIEIKAPVLLKLMRSKVFLRLKKIAQFGVPDKYYQVKGYSRFEHSVGVMLLLYLLDASLEEQVAGLLHDVSHTAFSHTVDWVLGSARKENFQDNRHARFAKDTELSMILREEGVDPDRIFSFKNFSLLDLEIPDLCADRIDYAFREFPKKDIVFGLKHLKVYNNKIVFDGKGPAQLFANNFLTLQQNHWGGFEATSRWHIFAKALKRAIDLKIFKFTDFYKDDDFIMVKLESSRDNKIQKWLSILANKSLSTLPKDNKKEYKKFRYVDPLFIFGKDLKRLTDVDSQFVKKLDKARKANKEGVTLPLFD